MNQKNNPGVAKNNPNVTWFDNIRWVEFASGLALVSGVLAVLKDAPLPPETRQWIGIAVSVLSTAAAFLRNPKRLEWVAPEGDKDTR